MPPGPDAIAAAAAATGASASQTLREALVLLERISHWYGEGALRKQILFDVSLAIRSGEIVIVTGPSGSGKTTLLTLIGALRSAQEGRLRVLGHDLTRASRATLVEVRRSIGYVFQSHNLLEALTARQNVEMSAALDPRSSPRDRARRAAETLRAVGLAAHADKRPDELSGGQRQRVAVARALVGAPKLVLADEPTASLDRQSGREVVELMGALAKEKGSALVLVTHDNRILDIADRIVHLEDGRLVSFTSACTLNTERMLEALTKTTRKGELAASVRDLAPTQFESLLSEVTGDFQRLLRVIGMSHNAAFESMLDQVLEAFTLKIGDLLSADRASVFLVDQERQELYSKVTKEGKEIRFPIGSGIAGRTARTGETLNIPDAYAEPLFNRAVDAETGYRTKSILCMPLLSGSGRVFAVMQLLNKTDGGAFDTGDEKRFREFTGQMGVILETWVSMKMQGPGAAA